MIELRPLGIEDYVERYSKPLSSSLEKLWLETFNMGHSTKMMGWALEAEFLKMLVLMTGARRIMQLGLFTGFSALAFAEALPRGGTVIACDTNRETTDFAKHYFAETQHGEKIQLKLLPALTFLKVVTGPFDICHINADRENYGAYYDACVDLVRPRGLIVIDNMVQSGKVLDPRDPGVAEVNALNKKIRDDARVENVLLPVRDGLMLVYKV
ncbi:MAG: methyltransferase [Deltaproteobacteria bacterium]|nr:methyltransferase [Deltaproteobacteria bacterium]